MNLATWSIRNPIPSVLLFVVLVLAGLNGFSKLAKQDLPDLDLPTVKIELRQPGAATSQLETEVARKVENALASLRGIKHARTQINDGVVSMTISFMLDRNLNEALTDCKDAIARIRNELPPELEEPRVTKVQVGPGGAMLSYALSHASWNEEQLSWFVDDALAKAIQAVPGVGDYSRVGGVKREVRVTLDPGKLLEADTTAADVSRALKRMQLDTSGGRGQLDHAEQSVKTLAASQTADDLARMSIVLPDGRKLRLDQVAHIEDNTADRTQVALLDGKAAVGFQVWRTKGFDEVKIAAGIEQVLQQLQAQTPGLQFVKVSSKVEHTLEQYEGSMHMLFEGALLSVLVIWLFLRDWRATLIGAVALPLSIIPAFAFMAWMGYSLNTITLLALAVVVGILVDDAIVEVENIAAHMHSGKPVREATEEAVNEIALAVAATTASLIVVFLPTAFMPGVPGLVFTQFGWSIVVAVALSFLVARIITPMMAVWLIRPGQHHEQANEGALMRGYVRCVSWCLAHPGKTVLTGLLLFALSLALIPMLPTGFMPAADRGTTTVNIELPPGAGLAQTLATSERARLAISNIKGVRSIFTQLGDSNRIEAGELRRASLVVVLSERDQRPKQQVIEQAIRERLDSLPGARISLSGGGSGEKLELVLSSSNQTALLETARALEAQLRTLPKLNSIISTASLERQDIVVRPNPLLAAERGVTTQAINDTLRVALSGDRAMALPKLNLDQRQIDIRVLLPADIRSDINAIAALRVPGRGALVPIHSVADLSVESGASQIDRFDRERQITLTADLGGSALGDALKAAKALPALQNLPASVHLLESGDAETQAEMFKGMRMAMGVGVLSLYAVLVLLFKDWFQPLTILSAVPLSVGGAFAALLLAGSELSLPTMIGLVMLMGIVTKNSILLVDFAIVAMEQDMDQHTALLTACKKRVQAITMTTVAMTAGMLPIALGYGADASFRQPMAIAVIGGLLSSTAMSLLMVPVVFTYVAALQEKILKRFHHTTKTTEEAT
ncbi:MAG: efflux RND transporter permease subunit [Burkholderiales bacterium]|nr:efflux RND transporter permease subunit [Burkholderiales bacterium]